MTDDVARIASGLTEAQRKTLMSAKTLFKALKLRRTQVVEAENWLTHAAFADLLAEEYER